MRAAHPLTILAALAACAVMLSIPSARATSPVIAGCPVFPADHVWNVPVDTLPLDANSSAYVATLCSTAAAHADFGTVYAGAPNGIPYVTVPGTQARVTVNFDYADESDPGPYPIPSDAPIEGGAASSGDRHVLVVDVEACKLYEMFAAYPAANGSWSAGSGALFDLRGYGLRPQTWTSADAAGLPLFPGLVRYDEVLSGEIAHALRFTATQTRNTYVWPARHQASSHTGSGYPPMGQRFRLKAGVDISRFGPRLQVILRALKKYGMFLADNGSSWYLSGAPDPRWNDDELHDLGQLHGSDFEAVDESSLMIDPDSGRARVNAPPAPSGGLAFTPVSPCRLADTRVSGGALQPRSPRTYAASDASRIAQSGGHAGGCAVPVGPSALAVTLTAVLPPQPGNLIAYPSDLAPPVASALNFLARQIVANTTIVPITPGTGDNFALFNNSDGATDVVVDVVGYFWENAAADCQKVSRSQVVAALTSGSAVAACDSGWQAVGGGCSVDTAGSIDWLDRRPDSRGAGFTCQAGNHGGNLATIIADVLCCPRAGR